MIGIKRLKVVIIIAVATILFVASFALARVWNTNAKANAEDNSVTDEVLSETREEVIYGMPTELSHPCPLSEVEQQKFYEAIKEYLNANTPIDGEVIDKDDYTNSDLWDTELFHPVYIGKAEGEYVPESEYLLVVYINRNGEPVRCHIHGKYSDGEVEILDFVYWKDATNPDTYYENVFGVAPGKIPMNGLDDFDYVRYSNWRKQKYHEMMD